MVVPNGRKPYDEIIRNIQMTAEILQGTNQKFRINVSEIKGPLLMKFNYLNELPSGFIIEMSYNERIDPI